MQKLTFLIAICALGAAGAAIFLAGSAPNPASGEKTGTVDREAMEGLVRDYILDNPEIIADAIRELQRRETEARQERLAAAAGEQWDALKSDAYSPVLGPETAPVTVVEFYDYRCSFCRRAYPDVVKLLETYSDDIRYVFKQFPVLDGADESDGISHTAARAAVAAAQQDLAKFREFHDRMMRRDGQLTKDRVFEFAAQAGLDVARLKDAMATPAIERYFVDTLDLARRIGVSGTPTYIINGRVLAGAQGFEAMRSLVEQGLEDG